MEKKLAIIGAGNLATRVSLALHNEGVEIAQVFSRTITSALTLSKLIGCSYVTKPIEITPDADIYIVSVSDLALEKLLKVINFKNKFVVHTSGSIPMEVLKKYSDNYGVFYPLQTFSKYRDVDFSNVPFCIEGNSPENERVLVELASVISKEVHCINSDQRKQLHLAAVFASNFANHMYTLAAEIVQQKGLSFDILKPLIAETASKIMNMAPREAQTGPAVRNDKNIIDEHLKMLTDNPKLKKLYSILSESIHETNKKAK